MDRSHGRQKAAESQVGVIKDREDRSEGIGLYHKVSKIEILGGRNFNSSGDGEVHGIGCCERGMKNQSPQNEQT